jgi:propanol-preferring alcohol dehydrogenase
VNAVRLIAWQSEPELRDVPVPEPGPGEVLVQVEAVGLCHSDLHVMDWPEGTLPFGLPFTLGHEVAGTVAALGPGARGVGEGDAVLVYGPWGCGVCGACARGAENVCEHRRGGCGLGFDGGLADYVLVPSPRLLVKRGDLDAVHAAPLTDAALTPYHALKRELWRLHPGTSVVVIGVGGLGHVAVQLVRELSPARIVAIDLDDSRLEHARAFGADVTINNGSDIAVAAVMELTGGLGADVAIDAHELGAADVRAETGSAGATLVLDFVGSDATVRLAASVIASGGHVSIVGSGGGSMFPLSLGAVPLEWSAGRPSWGTLPELHEVVALARAKLLEIEVERVPIEQAVDAYRRLRRGEIAARAVVVP